MHAIVDDRKEMLPMDNRSKVKIDTWAIQAVVKRRVCKSTRKVQCRIEGGRRVVERHNIGGKQ